MATARRHTLVTVLRAAVQEILEELVDRLAAAGHPRIRVAHSQVFENLDPNGTRLTVLARRARMAHPSMSELVADLERLGYLHRVPDPTDRRARLVQLTVRGRALQRLALAELAELEAAWLRGLGAKLGPEAVDALAAVRGEAPR
ncbi:MarR family winged helix-turn-helix transcriptional regulator [Pseudonocardia hispaniensis]|uniref:MarR family winged helix-turn-helix transcriptional regulator n=1 Tax=Pseudonocardia hispaniensis TaxID=904933 RepID=A0ABW1J501_9PSEU